ncbi:MAG: amino acid ABC transporter permease [Acidimicrobiia bacterium]|nr:amino acid ABC transporter permease [Acidimicrobiia bacterium]
MDFELIVDVFPLLWRATSLSLQMFVGGLILATFIGLVLALMRLSPILPIRWFAAVVIWFFRALPTLVIIFLAFFVVAREWLTFLSPLQAAIIGIGFGAGAYKAEIIRSGIDSVDTGQWEAAEALAMPKRLFMRRIILPQAVRVMIPPYLSNTVLVLQATSLATAIGIVELTGLSRQLANSTFQPIEIMITAAFIYLALSSVIVLFQMYLERRLALKT